MLWREGGRVAIAIGAVPMMALIVSGCGGATGRASADAEVPSARATATPAELRPLTQEEVATAVLSPGDLPTGWSTAEENLSPSTVRGVKGDMRGDPDCERVVADSHHNALSIAGGSRKLENASYTVISALEVYGSARDARQDLELARQLRRYCTTEAHVQAYDNDGTRLPVSYGVLSAPDRGDETVGVRMKINGIRIDEYVTRIGSNVMRVTLYGSAGDDQQLVRSLTAQAAEKTRQAAT